MPMQACSRERRKIVPPPLRIRACKNRHTGPNYAALVVRDNLWRPDAVFTNHEAEVWASQAPAVISNFCFIQLTELCRQVCWLSQSQWSHLDLQEKPKAFKCHTDAHIINHVYRNSLLILKGNKTWSLQPC